MQMNCKYIQKDLHISCPEDKKNRREKESTSIFLDSFHGRSLHSYSSAVITEEWNVSLHSYSTVAVMAEEWNATKRSYCVRGMECNQEIILENLACGLL